MIELFIGVIVVFLLWFGLSNPNGSVSFSKIDKVVEESFLSFMSVEDSPERNFVRFLDLVNDLAVFANENRLNMFKRTRITGTLEGLLRKYYIDGVRVVYVKISRDRILLNKSIGEILETRYS
jgi:hypothetical protein